MLSVGNGSVNCSSSNYAELKWVHLVIVFKYHSSDHNRFDPALVKQTAVIINIHG